MGIEVVGSNQSYQPSTSYSSAPAEPVSSAPKASTKVAAETNAVSQFVKPVGQAADGQIKAENGKQPTDEEVKAAINQANKRSKAVFGHANAEFSYHEATKRISVKIVDQDTNEVIREIPPEETLDMISKMWELAGIIVDEKR
jgi:flagellar protein FlaG